MFALPQFLKFLFSRAEPALGRDEAYLAQAVDIYDLERRMRAIDDRGRNGRSSFDFGLYPR